MNQKVERAVFRDLSYGLYIVTSMSKGRLNGQVVNTVIQVTSEPPRVAVIINKKNLTHEYILQSKLFATSVLEESTPMTFLGPFGFRSGRDVDKLSKVAYKEGIDQIDLGTHTIFVGNVVGSEILKKGNPLTYQYYHQVLKGKSPPNAPTYETKQ